MISTAINFFGYYTVRFSWRAPCSLLLHSSRIWLIYHVPGLEIKKECGHPYQCPLSSFQADPIHRTYPVNTHAGIFKRRELHLQQYKKISPKLKKNFKLFFALAYHNYFIALTYDIIALRLGGVPNELELEGSQWNAAEQRPTVLSHSNTLGGKTKSSLAPRGQPTQGCTQRWQK